VVDHMLFGFLMLRSVTEILAFKFLSYPKARRILHAFCSLKFMGCWFSPKFTLSCLPRGTPREKVS